MLGSGWNDKPFKCIRHNRTNHPRDLLSSESSSKSVNYINVVNEFNPESAELSNGRWAMIGITSLVGAYATIEQIIPGFFKRKFN